MGLGQNLTTMNAGLGAIATQKLLEEQQATNRLLQEQNWLLRTLLDRLAPAGEAAPPLPAPTPYTPQPSGRWTPSQPEPAPEKGRRRR